MVVVYFSGALVATYVTVRRHTPVDSNPHEHRIENLLQASVTNPVTLPVLGTNLRLDYICSHAN